jgi:hypothetical protein
MAFKTFNVFVKRTRRIMSGDRAVHKVIPCAPAHRLLARCNPAYSMAGGTGNGPLKPFTAFDSLCLCG